MSNVLVTGCAGFIGSHLTQRLLEDGHIVIGIDNFNDYYDPKIKERNIKPVLGNKKFKLYRVDILDIKKLKKIFEKHKINSIVHLAARAGVRPSIEDPYLYAQTNVLGTVNLLNLAVEFKVEKFVFGSSSSVYGNSKKLPFDETNLCQEIASPYGASKRAAEFFVEAFYKSYGLTSVILRFFTVYGPHGRPDMAPAIFSKLVTQGKPIKVFGSDTSQRDYTYVSDIVDGIVKSLFTKINFEVINIGRSDPIKLSELIKTIEGEVGKKAKMLRLDQQPGDVVKTWANTQKAKRLLDWSPKVSVKSGIAIYVKWLKNVK